MSNSGNKVLHAILVTFGSVLLMALSFALYAALFLALEKMFVAPNGEFDHRFVSPLRIGYGIVWILVVLLLYRTKMAEWLKAIFLAGGLASFWAGMGVQL